MPFLARIIAKERNAPTPSATHKISTKLGMDGTCSANTCKSGSATVMIMPSAKQISTGSKIFLDLLSWEPMPSPMGSMDISEPMVNRLIPTISIIVPNKNITRMPGYIGTREILSTKTMAKIGNTDFKDSPSAPPNSFCKRLFLNIISNPYLCALRRLQAATSLSTKIL